MRIGGRRLPADIMAALYDEAAPGRTGAAVDHVVDGVNGRALGLTAHRRLRAAGHRGTAHRRVPPLRGHGRTATLCGSEPTRTGEPVEIVRDHPVRRAPRAPESAEIRATGPRPRLRITLGEVCATRRCEVALSCRLCVTLTSRTPSEQLERLYAPVVLFSGTRKTPRRL
ncbi:hypothetical protein GCM10010294_37470 [Streptomyces griseoloalbus]|nr:hypothetical protein GCM10010294_37470 [Streptomyces griseoloalbus]